MKALAWLGALALALPALAQKPLAEKVDAAFFDRKVKPILEARCLGCHGVDGKLGNLDLRSRETALKGGTRGAALVPGQATASLFHKLITGTRAPLMPPGGKLPAEQIAVLQRWIDGGAPWGTGKIEKAEKQVWWSFKPLTRTHPGPPLRQGRVDASGASSRVGSGIDTFTAAKLKEAGLSLSPPAPKRVLIRRVYQDLIGLPPAPEDVEAFVRDTDPKAYSNIVEKLLASPQYGERWGRHWLDLARYADSGGFEGDKDRPLMYRYRDWVIDAFNADLPYDEFLRLQLAGDELKPNDYGALIATGYLACGPQDIVENNVRTRSNELDDLVATTGSVMLGLTVGCARCHDHKYDPVTINDYYRLSAVFAPTERREVEIPTPDERRVADARNAELEREAAPVRTQLEDAKKKGDMAAQKALEEKLKAIDSQRPNLPKAQAVTDKGREFGPAHVLLRGDAYHPGPEVKPGFICSLPGGAVDLGPATSEAKTTGRRTALANWIASKDNPLTARVMVNRIWRQHFGRGIVNSPSNLGINGELPSHPELLDWLAQQFIESGWSIKAMHRVMLLSRTYQQASDIRPAAQKLDPQNKLYWRMPVRRLEGEAIRDSLLAVAGTLNLEKGGPAVYPPVDPSLRADTFQGINWPEGEDSPKTWRRSVYVKVKRSLLLPQLEVFDCPEITYTVAARNVTTTPLQALTLLNDPLILRQASLFAQRLQRERPGDTWAQVDRAYRLCFGRAPTEKERQLSLRFLKTHPLSDFCHALLNLNEFVYVP